MELEFKKFGINGEGIAYSGKKTVFCPGVLPGETAEVRITEENTSFLRTEPVRIIKASPKRRRSRLSAEERCEGCALALLSYPDQLQVKKQLLAETLWKYGHVRSHFIRDVHASPHRSHYRTACKLPVHDFHGQLVNGMYEPGTNHFQVIREFITHTPALEKQRLRALDILNRHRMKAFDARTGHGIRYLVIRALQDQTQITLVTGKDQLPADMIRELCGDDEQRAVFQSINDRKKSAAVFGTPARLLAGPDALCAEIGNIRIMLAPEAFFQLNSEQAAELYRTAIAKVDPCGRLVEAYCGAGAMSLMAADKAEEVIGIENVREAVENAAENARLNGVDNARFLCADAAAGLRRLVQEKAVDTLLVDPPRSGLDDAMIEAIMAADIRKIIYVSCNPATLGKNLIILKQHYQVRTVIPFDMFPQTPHIESVTVLERG